MYGVKKALLGFLLLSDDVIVVVALNELILPNVDAIFVELMVHLFWILAHFPVVPAVIISEELLQEIEVKVHENEFSIKTIQKNISHSIA